MNEEHKENENCLTFPKHFEVRFAEHTLNVLKAVLHNLEAAINVWTKMCDGTIPTERTEKQMAQGFLRKWEKGSLQLWLTAVIYDLCNIFKILQLLFQKSNLILPDIISGKDGAIESLKLMAEIPFPGGKEEDYHEGCQVVINGYETNVRQTAKAHRFATPRSRDKGAIRRETVQSVKNFLAQRMIVEENDTINNLS